MELKIDDDTADRLARRAERHGFDSTEAYVRVLLKTVLDELEEFEGGADVESRLEDLGYL